MFQKLLSIFKITDLRNKILFVLGVFVVFRVMANIPIPGIDASRLHEFFEGNQLFGLLNLFTGGALDNLSLVMLGLGPYITAVIVLQLLTMIFPAFERMYKEEGEAGRQKFNQYGRMLAVPFALVQGYAFLTLLSRQGIIDRLAPLEYVTALGTVIAGTLFLMWLGELITEKGIGNGVSLLIFAGIVAEFPLNARQMFVDWDPTRTLPIASFFLMAFLIVAGVALSLLLFPGMIANFFLGADGIIGSVARFVVTYFDPSGWGYIVAYFLLVGVFTFFYTAVTFDPKSISTNLQKMGGFVPGVRPGSSTAEHISYILNRILLIGALFLGTVAVMPFLVQFVTEVTAFQFLLGGTALLIMVTVALETMRQIRAQLQMRDYDTF
ncbi:MAG: Protein translocase subunit SecY [Parcubacteria group bacterium GW2011_GWA2_50_10]|nr:MAG: Protein translocase subunit SecY [Parcubacteria group bacterium GW2011_GWA2_50_10]